MSSASQRQGGAAGGDVLVLGDGRRVGCGSVWRRGGVPGHRVARDAWVAADVRHRGAGGGAAGIRLIAVDRPGYGRSDPRAGGTLLDYAGDVAAIAQIIGLDRFAVLGTSGGGCYALACAAGLGSRLTRVGVVSGIGSLRTPGKRVGHGAGKPLDLPPPAVRRLWWVSSCPGWFAACCRSCRPMWRRGRPPPRQSRPLSSLWSWPTRGRRSGKAGQASP